MSVEIRTGLDNVTAEPIPRRAIWLLCMAAFLSTSLASYLAFERLPHLEDEVAYLFQARTLAIGRLTVASPEVPESFWTPFVLDYQGRRFGKYPPGWPAVLAVGVLAGTPWLVNPLLAAIALYLVYRIGLTLFDARTGLLAAVLGLLSPLLLVLGGSFLSHLCTLVALLLFTLWFVRVAQGHGRWCALGAGAALGVAFLTRSLTAVAYAVPFALYALAQLARRRQAHWPHYLFVAASGLAVAALLPLYQWAVTGHPWLNPYVLWWPYDRLGFGPGIGAMPGGHSLRLAWVNLKQDLGRSATDVLGWPALSWLPALLALALARRQRRVWALAAPFACLVIAYVFYWIGSPARLWGPRYYFEGFAGLWLLSAVGLVRTWEHTRRYRRWVRVVLATCLAVLVGLNLALNLPSRMSEAHGFYGIARDQLRPIQAAGLHNAVVIVYAERWLEYGAMLGQMSPTRDDDIVYVRSSRPDVDASVLAMYPGRSVYYLKGGALSTDPPGP